MSTNHTEAVGGPDVDHLATPDLRRLHPLTPIFQSWKAAGAILAVVLGMFRDELERIKWVWAALHGDAELSVLFKALGVIFVVAMVCVVVAWMSWRVTGFGIVGDRQHGATLLFQRGLFVRRRSQVRLRRVQSVDVNQPFFPRLVGLAVVRLEMAAGEGASVGLAYLNASDAWQLRTEMLRYTSVDAEPEGVELQERTDVIARVPLERLVKASLLEGLGFWVVALLYLVALVVAWVVLGTTAFVAALSGFVPVTIAFVVYARNRVVAVLRDANFTLMRTSNGVRVSAGLTSTINRTVDFDRIQGITLDEPYLWRRLGWARVTVDIAGARATNGGEEVRNSLIPVADRAMALTLIREVTGADLTTPDIQGPGRGAKLLDPLGFPVLGVALLDDGAVSRRGRLRRTHAYVPYARIQSVTVTQGWVQRWRRVATVWLDQAAGGRRWHGDHRDLASAQDLVHELTLRARVHRRPHRGREGPALPAEPSES